MQFLIFVLILFVPSVVTDLRQRKIPWVYALIVSVLGAACNLIFRWLSWKEIVGGALLGGLFFLFSFLSKEAIGYGDSVLILGIGILCGGSVAVLSSFAALLCAGLFGVIYVLVRRKGKKYRLPFAPFLAFTSIGLCLWQWISILLPE